jgi:transglutaminase-like putative cysteine protease
MHIILGAIGMGILAAVGVGETKPPPGAASLFASELPIIVEARLLVEKGDLAVADRRLEEAAKASPQRAGDYNDAREIIRRIRSDYSQTAEQLLRKLRSSISDISEADLDTWRKNGGVQFREIDGKVWYFNREPAGILLFNEQAIARRDKQQKDAIASKNARSKARLIEHIKAVIAEAASTGKDQVVPIRHRINYSLTVKANRPGEKAGSLLRCWLPFPQEYRQQKDVKLIRSVPEKHVLAPTGTYKGQDIGGAPQRTLYLEQRVDDPTKPVKFQEEFEYTVSAYYPQISEDKARQLPADYADGCLEERPPHIVFTPEIREAVRKVVGEEKNPLAAARKIYHFISDNMRWCPEEEYTLIPSLSLKVLRTHRGDCGVQSTLFITMCRAAGIPARWQSGWESQPEDSNMHDWAEFYIAPWGWLPADASYGLQKSDDPAVREFYLGHLDSYRMIVNLDYGRQLQPAKETLRSEPLDFQRGEVELDGRNLYFPDWEYEINYQLEPAK